jgi:hypothetical protein
MREHHWLNNTSCRLLSAQSANLLTDRSGCPSGRSGRTNLQLLLLQRLTTGSGSPPSAPSKLVLHVLHLLHEVHHLQRNHAFLLNCRHHPVRIRPVLLEQLRLNRTPRLSSGCAPAHAAAKSCAAMRIGLPTSDDMPIIKCAAMCASCCWPENALKGIHAIQHIWRSPWRRVPRHLIAWAVAKSRQCHEHSTPHTHGNTPRTCCASEEQSAPVCSCVCAKRNTLRRRERCWGPPPARPQPCC